MEKENIIFIENTNAKLFFLKDSDKNVIKEVNPKNAVFANSQEIHEASKCILGRAVDENNVDEVVALIEKKK